MKKIYFYILGFVLFLLVGTGMAFAAYPDFTKTFIVNFPPNQNVTVKNTEPIAVDQIVALKKWEYKTLIIYSNTSAEQIDAQINQVAAKGWELTEHSTRGTNYNDVFVYDYVFKKPIQ